MIAISKTCLKSLQNKNILIFESLTDTLNFRTIGYFLTNLINDPSSLKLQSRNQNLILNTNISIHIDSIFLNSRIFLLSHGSREACDAGEFHLKTKSRDFLVIKIRPFTINTYA